jgi:hypothetical protein
MSKYISQINNQNFVYPNYDLAEYDVDIVHNINNTSISGIVTSFSASTVSSSSITVRSTNTWSRNGAEVFIRPSNLLSIYSLHVLAPNQLYYKPWRAIDSVSTSLTGSTTFTTTNRNAVFIPSQLGLTTFVSGVYNFEFRFIGATSIFPVCAPLSITIP